MSEENDVRPMYLPVLWKRGTVAAFLAVATLLILMTPSIVPDWVGLLGIALALPLCLQDVREFFAADSRQDVTMDDPGSITKFLWNYWSQPVIGWSKKKASHLKVWYFVLVGVLAVGQPVVSGAIFVVTRTGSWQLTGLISLATTFVVVTSLVAFLNRRKRKAAEAAAAATTS